MYMYVYIYIYVVYCIYIHIYIYIYNHVMHKYASSGTVTMSKHHCPDPKIVLI